MLLVKELNNPVEKWPGCSCTPGGADSQITSFPDFN